MKAIFWGLVTALFVRFGLEPSAWFFYEASHALSLDWLYWGYSIFRGAAFALGLYGYHVIASVLAGLVVAGIVAFFTRHSQSESSA
ncbi:MAG: hypothetical protein AB8B48_19555 [Pseudomonadales bacterium]